RGVAVRAGGVPVVLRHSVARIGEIAQTAGSPGILRIALRRGIVRRRLRILARRSVQRPVVEASLLLDLAVRLTRLVVGGRLLQALLILFGPRLRRIEQGAIAHLLLVRQFSIPAAGQEVEFLRLGECGDGVYLLLGEGAAVGGRGIEEDAVEPLLLRRQ